MAFYGPQPRLNKKMTTPGFGVRSGAGQNAKGTPKKINNKMIPGGSQPTKKPGGFFQWGSEQYGYVNPSGHVNWNATKPLDPNWRKKHSLIARPYGTPPMPAKAAPPGFLDPSYFGYMAQQQADYNTQKLGLNQQIESLQSQYGVDPETGATTPGSLMDQLNRDLAKRTSQETAHLGASGFGRSGMVGTSAREREQDFLTATNQLKEQVGPAAQARLQAQIQQLNANLATIKKAQQGLSKERFKAENLARTAAGLEPRSATTVPRGWHKKGSTWFYTNPQGVTVSLGSKVPPGEAARRLREKKKKGRNKVQKINGQSVNIL